MSHRAFLAYKLVFFVFIFILFAFKIFTFTDPDFGWHLRAGEAMVTTGELSHTDTWNYVLPAYPWIDNEWPIDILFWKTWGTPNWTLVQILFLLMSVAPFAYLMHKAKYLFSVLFIVIAGLYLYDIVGVRPQIITYLFYFLMCVFLYGTLAKKTIHRLLLVLPIFFYLWANMHSGFPAALLLWGLTIGGTLVYALMEKRLAREIRTQLPQIASLLASSIATLCTPHHTALWVEIFTSTSFVGMTRIAEWQSAFMHWRFTLVFFVIFGFGILYMTAKKKDSPVLLTLAAFFYLFLKHVRMAPMFFFVALAALNTGVERWYTWVSEVQGKRAPKVRAQLEWGALIATVLVCVSMLNTPNITTPVAPATDAIAALHTPAIARIPGNVFNDYQYGGWMLLVNPDQKVFINGRMSQWVLPDGRRMIELYLDVLEKPNAWKHVFATYDIHKTILPVDSLPLVLHEEEIGSFKSEATKTLVERQSGTLASQLIANDWCVKYRNQDAVILVSPEYCTKGAQPAL